MVNNNEKDARKYIIHSILALENFLSDGTIPREGMMKDFDIQFPNLDTENQLGIIRISGDNNDRKKRLLKIGATEANSKHTVVMDLFSGTFDEMVEYLKSDGLADNWYDALSKVSQQYCSVDWNGISKLFENSPKEKFERYKRDAEAGNAEAAYNLSVCYRNGDGTPQNHEEAFKWTKISAEAGNVRAAYNLSICYKMGDGTPQNHEEAFKWTKISAEAGNVGAAYNLGVFYMFGQGTPQNSDEAFKWFKISAEAGEAKAAYELGVCYAHGDGTPVDYEESLKWYKISAEVGNANAAYILGNFYLYGTPQNYEEAFKWYKISAEAGNVEAAKKIKDFPNGY